MKRVFVVLMCVLCWSAIVRGQSAAIQLTLPEAIARGLESSHRLAELLAREEAARAVEDQREAATQPQMSLIGSYTRTNHVEEFGVPNASGGVRILYPDIPDNVRSRVDLQWPIYTGGRLKSLINAAGAEAEATVQDREAARADLKLEITRAYWAVVTARASQAVVDQALEQTNAHLADVRAQLSVGLISPSDVLSIEAQLARQQMLRIETANLIDSTSAELRKLIGLEPDASFEQVDVLSPADPRYKVGSGIRGQALPSIFADSASLGPLVNTARTVRPERKALQFRIDAAAERVAAAGAGTLPVLTAIGGYDFARPNPRIFPIQREWKPSWDLGVNVRWPLFEGGRTRAEISEAAANRRAVEARLREFDSSLEVEVRQRAADARSAEASIQAALAGVNAAREARRVLGERFSVGVATSTDVLSAQLALLQAELDMRRALANAQLAFARLDRALGR